MYGSYKGIDTKEELDAVENFIESFDKLLLFQCKKRCPTNDGYENKCEYCDVQHLLRVCSAMFRTKAEFGNLYYALRWLIEEPHRQFDE